PRPRLPGRLQGPLQHRPDHRRVARRPHDRRPQRRCLRRRQPQPLHRDPAGAGQEMRPGVSRGAKAAGVAWLITALYYFYQYTLRSAPAVMMPQLEEAFGLTAMGVASMVGLFYWGYSPFSLVAGAAMDLLGPRRVVPVGAAAVGVGALLFAS